MITKTGFENHVDLAYKRGYNKGKSEVLHKIIMILYDENELISNVFPNHNFRKPENVIKNILRKVKELEECEKLE